MVGESYDGLLVPGERPYEGDGLRVTGLGAEGLLYAGFFVGVAGRALNFRNGFLVVVVDW